MAPFNNLNKINKYLVWLIYIRKRTNFRKKHGKKLLKSKSWTDARSKSLLFFMNAILIAINSRRTRALWMNPRSLAWFDMVDSDFDDDLWYTNFRVTKETFNFLLNEVRHSILHKNTSMRLAITAKRRLALTLYYLASTAEYKTIANLFGVSRSFVCICIRDVSRAITKRMSKFITFPRGQDIHQVIDGYYRKWGFPMCAGAIDGTHIPIIAPTESHEDYVNRKGFHSIIMQACVDCNYLFRDVVIGWPGSVHDARVFSNSAIYKQGNEGKLFPPDLKKEINGEELSPVILADPAYPLLPWLLKGYPLKGVLTRKQRVFNYRISRARMTVENTFGKWKGRFIRFSKRVDMNVKNLVILVLASCILHNICEVQNNNFLPQWEENVDQELVVPTSDVIEDDGEDIREILADYFDSQ